MEAYLILTGTLVSLFGWRNLEMVFKNITWLALLAISANALAAGNPAVITGNAIVSGNTSIVNADINAAAGIVDTKLATISTASKVSNSATTATSANTNSAIVARDGSGNFSATTVTAAVTGTASGNLTLSSPTNHGVLLSGSANATSATGVGTTGQVLTGNTGADPTWQTPGTTAANAQSASYALLTTDSTVNFTTAASNYNATLPTAVGVSGKRYTITKADSGAGVVTILTTSSQTIGGISSGVIKLNSIREYIAVESDGANWVIVATYNPVVCTYTGGSVTGMTAGTTITGWTTKIVDTYSAFSAGVFTAPFAGFYEISYMAFMNFGTSSFITYSVGGTGSTGAVEQNSAQISATGRSGGMYPQVFYLTGGQTLFATIGSTDGTPTTNSGNSHITVKLIR